MGSDFIGPLGAAALPVCIGIAVLKYRLFEIDRIISRVISSPSSRPYSPVCSPGWCCWPPKCSHSRHQWRWQPRHWLAAALFNPLRRRVQHAVDRRFNRARYNADLTVAAFASRLKDAVDLDSVREDLATAVQKALEPAYISVWMNERGETR